MNIDELRKINEKKIDELSILNDNEKDLNIHKMLKELLMDDTLFFKIKMDEALKILSVLVDEKDLLNTYKSLISPDEYQKLKK